MNWHKEPPELFEKRDTPGVLQSFPLDNGNVFSTICSDAVYFRQYLYVFYSVFELYCPISAQRYKGKDPRTMPPFEQPPASPSIRSGEIPEIDHDFQHAAGVLMKILKGLSGLAERIDVGYDAVKLQVPASDGIDQFDEIPGQRVA